MYWNFSDSICGTKYNTILDIVSNNETKEKSKMADINRK